MVCPNDTQVRQNLEALYQKSPAVPIHKQFIGFFKQIGAAIVSELTRDRNEPRISKFYDLEGHVFWHIFDPLTQQRFLCVSETEVREWLERRYRE
ncbi:hypothetical protein PN498_19475 [Oscillatoria sp. CS-180]|uniref:hypothetical protein n=1 Tax=Oscillatoria sp. CS-180 TaxID=3021720 RepID=UPI00232D393F|nr:hypothetical protein [Oscillatoria sp. CS-180]MDB9528182.1 hypothetical protein [Oscillatoria sp. CS-180]